MALIGFLALVVLGGGFVFYGLVLAYLSAGFSGRVEWPPVLMLLLIGGGLLYAALTNSPISISWSVA